MLFEQQQYQEDCVRNITSIFKQVKDFVNLSSEDRQSILDNINTLQAQENIPITNRTDKLQLDILMETGTGKTFTYLKAMYQLNKDYGINKFLLFVPRTAIREGVIQNIELTSDYFFGEYGKRIRKYTYEGKAGLQQIKSYYRSNEFSLLILTGASIASRRKVDRILTSPSEYTGLGTSPLDLISQMKPIIFVDEPHLLTGDVFLESMSIFSQSIVLRFGATFPTEEQHKLANVVYLLGSLPAFRQHLVKKIQVTTLIDNIEDIKFSYVDRNSVKVHYFNENVEYTKKMTKRDDLGTLVGITVYAGVYITRITKGKIFLSNNKAFDTTGNNYQLKENSIRLMVRKTISLHFAKEENLFIKDIKTLSLFFIPNVHDYRGNEPVIKEIFEEEYRKAREEKLNEDGINPTYRAYLLNDIDENGILKVHNGYFSGDRGNKEERESDAVNLILKDKTKLLSFSTSLRFIFSVWALQEGWDNPNIFTLCKLASSGRETSRRQQVGRGLRLAVNQSGRRQTIGHCDDHTFSSINLLDVVVSSHEKVFIEEIQREITENSFGIAGDVLTFSMLSNDIALNDSEATKLISILEDAQVIIFDEKTEQYSINAPIYDFLNENFDDLPDALKAKYKILLDFFSDAMLSPVINGNKKQLMITLRKENFKKFETLWHTITQSSKIIYEDIDTSKLIDEITSCFNNEQVSPVYTVSRTQRYDHSVNEVINLNQEVLGTHNFFENQNSLKKFIFNFAKEMRLPLSFIIQIMNGINRNSMKNDPKKSSDLLKNIIQECIHQHIIQSVSYNFSSEIRINKRGVFYDNKGNVRDQIEAFKIGKYPTTDKDVMSSPNNYLYSAMRYDSNIELETIKTCPEVIGDNKVTVFAKLPSISIPTPYKTYNPDFAYLIERAEGKTLFLIVETKGYEKEGDIPTSEMKKIEYAEKFFKHLNISFPNASIVFEKMINKQRLEVLLHDIQQQEN